MNQSVGVSFSQEDIITITMIVTDKDKDEVLNFLIGLEKKIRTIQQGHCAPRIGKS